MNSLTFILAPLVLALVPVALIKIGLKKFFKGERQNDSYITFRSGRSPVKQTMLIQSH